MAHQNQCGGLANAKGTQAYSSSRVDCTGRERTQATLEKQDSCDENFQGAEAYCWRFKAEGTSFRNRIDSGPKGVLVGVDLTRTMPCSVLSAMWLDCVRSYGGGC